MATLWLDLLGAEVRFYDAGGIRTRSIQAGGGEETVLFLHGTGSTAETFARNLMPFAARYDARAIDILGHGLTGTCDGPLTKAGFVAHVIAYLDAAGIERAHLVGSSLGAWIAIWVALLHPERVGKIVNVVGPHLAVPVADELRRQGQAASDELKRLSHRLAEDPTPANLRARLGWVFHDVDRDLTDELVAVRWALHQRTTNGRQIGALVGNPGAENLLTPERLASLTHPTMFVWSDHNPTPAAVAEAAFSYLPNGQFVLMTDCGHWPQWEDAPTFNRHVLAFLGAEALVAR